jgi:hypothetical protein
MVINHRLRSRARRNEVDDLEISWARGRHMDLFYSGFRVYPAVPVINRAPRWKVR